MELTSHIFKWTIVISILFIQTVAPTIKKFWVGSKNFSKITYTIFVLSVYVGGDRGGEARLTKYGNTKLNYVFYTQIIKL